ncbi:hypothetical protein P0082_05580 [Candidatus Haliotispira prima]|uniref:Uncharacterized protein n=1 Tax=Candidatus Haliotispira prima TaxID=3034016 RepID=A0ABY8MKJ0_9SPIO|nr:hypothetical protein P0082_05580 [Candidatus Haliotispira prima]
MLIGCSLDGSPFQIDSDSPFNIDQLKIVDSLRYLPNNPADVTAGDLRFFRNKPWIEINTMSPGFTAANGQDAKFYEDFDIRLTHMKYLVHTRAFATAVGQHTFALKNNNAGRDTIFVLEGLETENYIKSLDKTYHVNPLEVLLMMRNMNYLVDIYRNSQLLTPSGGSYYTAVLGKVGNFQPKLPFLSWDPVSDGGFTHQSTININGKWSGVAISLLMHEVLHNWGYNHPAKEGVALPAKYGDIPYGVQALIDQVYKKTTYEALYLASSASGKLPTLYDSLSKSTLPDSGSKDK